MSYRRERDSRTGFSEAAEGILAAQGKRPSDLARAAGVSRASVAGLLSKDNPSIEVAVRYMASLGYDVALVPSGKRLPEGSYVMGAR